MTTELTVSGMSCDGCADVVEYAVELADGVDSASADHESGVVTIEGSVDRETVAEKVRMAGYGVSD